MAKIDDLFRLMLAEGASDLHLRAGSPPNFRIHGEMIPVKYRSLTDDECKALIFEIINEKQLEELKTTLELDIAYSVEGLGRFRCNVFFHRLGVGAVFRVIPEKIKTIDDMGLPKQLRDLVAVEKGLILVTGPTGSGKSTTLAALIHEINMHHKSHIITIEDPIEFVHQPVKCLISQREIKSHTMSFGNALRAALREDPDIILVGEMRDLETISLAMTAAETGHLVFGTLHTNNASKAIDRVIDVFPPEQQEQIRVMLAESLRGVVAQGLMKRIDSQGRIAVIEILVNNTAVSNLIREGKTFQIPSTMQTASQQGMITFDASLTEHVLANRISKTAAEAFLGRKLQNPSMNSPQFDNSQGPGGANPYGLGAIKKRA